MKGDKKMVNQFDRIITFRNGTPIEINAELYQHGVKIGDRYLYYYNLENFLISNVLLVNITDRGAITPIAPIAPTFLPNNRESQRIQKRIDIAKHYLSDIKQGKKLSFDINDLLPFIEVAEEHVVNATSEIKSIEVPFEIEGKRAKAHLDTKSSIFVFSNKIKIKDKKEEARAVGVRTVNGVSYTRPFTAAVKVNGKEMQVRAIQMDLGNEDALIDPDTAQKAGIKLKVEGIK